MHQYFVKIVDIHNKPIIEKIEHFLKKNDLKMGLYIEYFVQITDTETDELIACGAISKGGVIKCIAIDDNSRGLGIALNLFTEINKLAFDLGYRDLFLFTKPENEDLFKNCGLYTIEKTSRVILMENSSQNIHKYLKNLKEENSCRTGVHGAVIVNANPFTKGHQYLIEEASKQCDWLHVFVIEEDLSFFSFKDRFDLVAKGISELKRDNVLLHKGGKYIISRATFPTYFIKEESFIDEIFYELDLKIFRKYISTTLGITKRFVGEEPICKLTKGYNLAMQKWLQEKDSEYPEVKVKVLKRKKVNDVLVSASVVRKHFKEGKIEEIEDFIPASTYKFLKTIKK